MLAAENPSVDGHVASSTPRRGGMDCKTSNSAKKKLVQARLPFKRLNPESKQSPEPKRPCAPPCAEPGASDVENETEPTPLPVRHGPALVNGRGPLDGFMSRSRAAPSENMVIDLTEDNTSSPIKLPTTSASVSPCLPTKDKHQSKDKRASFGKPTNSDHTPKTGALDRVVNEAEKDEDVKEMEEKDGEETASTSLLETTQESESEEEDGEESVKADVSSIGNESMLSPSSVSSLSAAESSPEQAKSESSSTPTTTPKIPADQKTVKRRSMKGLQEKFRLREEKERQREEAKAAKEKKKEEARKQKEEREREKREKKEKEEREKREKKEKEEKEKAERIKAKEEQRKSKQEAKLEEKRKKEEEKRLKEEEKRLKEEKDRLKAEKAEITRFLQKQKTQQAPKTLAAACGKFAPFEIKENMCLAPLTRVQCEDSVLEELDRYLLEPDDSLDGLKDWIRNKPCRSGPTKARRTDLHRECVVAGPKPDGVPDRKRYGPMKLLQFRENYRPAYWGTWSKKSSNISPRCPLRQDKDLLDYEVDSDEEWEEEEPGESLSHSEGEDEEEGGDNDDDDNDGFFVPHGYLSDGEGALEEEEERGDLEKQKVRQKLKAREWDELMSTKKKVKVLEAVVRGCVWDGEGPALELFQPFAVCLLEPLPKMDTTPSPEESAEKRRCDEQLLSQLLPLLHGNVNSSKVIITEFREYCRQHTTTSSSPPSLSSPHSSADNIPTRIGLKRLIKSNAVYEKRSAHRRCCWYVHAEVLSHFKQEALPVPCQWTYLTSGAREEPRDEPQAATGSEGNSPNTPHSSTTTSSSSNKRKSTGSMSITKFMKRCADPEQTEVMETDGFQADTEDDDEDTDCVIISTQSGTFKENTSNNPTATEGAGSDQMEATPSDKAALPAPCPAPTIATA